MAQVNIQYTADISQLNSKLDQIIQKQDQVIDGSKKTEKSISDAASKSADSLNKVTSSLTKVGAALGIAFSVKQIIEFTKTIFEAERSMELLQNRLNFFAGSAASGEQMFTRLEATSRRLGLNLNDTAEGLASFGIAAKQAGFSAQKSEKIFVQVASGLRAAGASSLQTQRAFYALQQMMSKGVVAAEELRRQLGESLPGASDLMTKAYNRLHPAANLTNLEFTKLLESGKIISKDILPVFAQVIEETFSPALAGKQNSLDASLNKVNNEILKLKLNLGNASWFKTGIDAISEGMFTLNAVMSSDKLSNLEKFNALMFSNLASEKLQKFVGAYDDIKTAIDEFNNKVEQAITTNKVFGDALEKQSENYKTYSTEQREATKRNTDSEIESNEVIIKSSKEKLKEYDKLIKATKEDFQEQIKVATYGKTKIQAYGIEQKMLKDLSNQIKNITDSRSEDEKKAITSLQNAESRNEFLKELLIEFYNLDEELNNEQKKRKEEADEAEKQRLKNEVARLEKIRLEQRKGSAEELIAYTNVIKAKANLDAFSAKGKEEKDLIMLKAEMDNMDAILEYQRGAQKQSLDDQIAAERERLANVEKGGKEELKIKSRIILLEAKLRAAQPDLSPQEMDAILAEADSAVIELTKKFDDAAKAAADAFEKNKKKISDGIQAPFLDAIGKEIENSKSHYAELFRLNQENLDKKLISWEEYTQTVKDLQRGLQKDIDNITKDGNQKQSKIDQDILNDKLRDAQIITDATFDFFDSRLNLEAELAKAAVENLDSLLKNGVITQKQYEDQKAVLMREQFEKEKSLQISRALMNGAAAILNIIGNPTTFKLAPILIPLAVAQTAQQLSLIEAQAPAFKDGVINLQGPGTSKSDSITAMLSKGESVMTAEETEKYGDVLQSIRNGTFDKLSRDRFLLVVLPFIIPTLQMFGALMAASKLSNRDAQGFKDGVIGLNGPGTATSDSIMARLSKGESVMTAEETNKHRDVLQAIREDRLPSLIAEKYMIPAYKNSLDVPRGKAAESSSMEVAFQTAELVQAIKNNKKIKIANVEDFSKVMNSKSTSQYMARRRKW